MIAQGCHTVLGLGSRTACSHSCSGATAEPTDQLIRAKHCPEAATAEPGSSPGSPFPHLHSEATPALCGRAAGGPLRRAPPPCGHHAQTPGSWGRQWCYRHGGEAAVCPRKQSQLWLSAGGSGHLCAHAWDTVEAATCSALHVVVVGKWVHCGVTSPCSHALDSGAAPAPQVSTARGPGDVPRWPQPGQGRRPTPPPPKAGGLWAGAPDSRLGHVAVGSGELRADFPG